MVCRTQRGKDETPTPGHGFPRRSADLDRLLGPEVPDRFTLVAGARGPPAPRQFRRARPPRTKGHGGMGNLGPETA